MWIRQGLRRMLQENSTPLRLGAGAALGTFIGLTPLYGLHIILVLALAPVLRVNLPAALLASQISNPLLAPLLIYASVWLGEWLGAGSGPAIALDGSKGAGFVRAWFVGGTVLGVLAGLALGAAVALLRAVLCRRWQARPAMEDP